MTAEKNRPYAEVLGENLKKFRKKSGYTREAIASAAGVTAVGFIGYENGSRVPSLDKLFAIADFLGVNVSDLIGEESVTTYRISRAKKLVTSCGFTVTFVKNDGTLEVDYGKIDEKNFFTDKKETFSWWSKLIRFGTEKDFARFTESAADKAISENIPFKESFERMADDWNKRRSAK